jgi:excisionase family DNA binding protein
VQACRPMARVTPLPPPAPRRNARNTPPPAVEPAQYTYAEAQQILRLSHMTVRKYVEAGELPTVRYGRAVRFRRTDLEAFMAAHVTTDGDKAPRQRRPRRQTAS